jgi:hypothetical protein
MNVVYDRETEDDVVDAVARYEEQPAGQGEAFMAAVHRSAQALRRRLMRLRHPVHGHLGVKVAMVQRFPHRRFFLVEGPELVVFAVALDGRQTDSWVHRRRRRSLPTMYRGARQRLTSSARST